MAVWSCSHRRVSINETVKHHTTARPNHQLIKKLKSRSLQRHRPRHGAILVRRGEGVQRPRPPTSTAQLMVIKGVTGIQDELLFITVGHSPSPPPNYQHYLGQHTRHGYNALKHSLLTTRKVTTASTSHVTDYPHSSSFLTLRPLFYPSRRGGGGAYLHHSLRHLKKESTMTVTAVRFTGQENGDEDGKRLQDDSVNPTTCLSKQEAICTFWRKMRGWGWGGGEPLLL